VSARPRRRTAALLAAALVTAAVPSLQAQEFPLKIGPGGRTLVDQHGVPFFIHGDTPWSLTHNLTFEEAERYLQDRRARGFDALMISAPDAYDPDGKASYPPDRYGRQPFEAGDWTRPVEAYWAHVERVLRRAEELRFLVLFAPAYLGCCDDGYVDELKRNGARKALVYGRWIGRRFSGLTNLVWVHGGDRNPYGVEEEVRAVARGIRETDPRHLHTGHWDSNGSALDHFAHEGWLDFNSSYTYGPVAWRVLDDRARHPDKPTFLIETHYEDDFGRRTAEDVRGYPYRAVLAGAAGHLFGNKPLWFCGRGWEAALDRPGSRYMSHVRALFESREWWRLLPDLEQRFVVHGRGDPGGHDGVQVAVSDARDTLIAYFPSPRAIRVAFGRLAGARWRVWWFDPRSGHATDGGLVETPGFSELKPPAEGDWVLVIDDAAAEHPAPGRDGSPRTR